jgi:hypothetical protein
MSKHTYQQILLSNFILDLENPRHDRIEDQESVIAEFLDRQGDKIIRLVKDIAAEGTNPADLPIVIPAETESGKFIVVEGNRRVVALKLLENPELVMLVGKAVYKRRLEELSKQFGSNRPDSLQCVVFPNREDANHWIELRHTGQNNGVGIVEWDAASVARFKKGQSWMALQVVDYVKSKIPDDAELRRQIDRISLTNVARLVNDPDVRTALGIRAENGRLKSNQSEEEVQRALIKVVTDIATRKIKVDNIKKKTQRQKYIEDLSRNGHTPSSAKMRVQSWGLPVSPVKGGIRRGRPPSSSRKALIPSNCVLRISQHRINDIHRELKATDVDKYPNCSSVMLRVFLELSLDEFIDLQKVPLKKSKTPKKWPSLSSKILAVADFLEGKGVLTRAQLMFMRSSAKKKNELFSADMLHTYVHNRHLAPKASEIKTTWDNMQSFMEALWP